MVTTLLSHLKNLNAFVSGNTANNEYELENERISTRIFILLLIFSVLIIFIYAAQSSVTHTIDVNNPSYDYFQTLSALYPQTLQCPCTNVAIFHDSFILLEAQLHQLCSSIFITQNWINYIGSAADIHVSEDFSYISALFFLTLASFCQRANDTIINELQTFNSNQFITATALVENTFNEQINVVIQSFQSTTELKYYQAFNLIQFSLQADLLLTGLLSNTVLEYDSVDSFLVPTSRFYENNTCSCDVTHTCIASLTLQDRRTNQSNSSLLFTIPGLFKGCYLVEAVRQSSLECFYQASCIAMIELFLQPPISLNNTISPLDSSIESRFNVSSTIDQLISKVMAEKWNKNISHAQYFTQCKVLSCTYSFISKFNIAYIITTLIALVGGLTKVLRLIIPRVVKFIRHRVVPDPTGTNELNVVHHSPIERIRTYNYYSKPYPISTEIETKQQIISTRLFILLLILSIIVLMSYYGAEKVIILHKIESPTFDQFINLQSDQHANPTFSCPCSTLSIAYEKFIQLEYNLHPLCSSDFVQQQWLYSLGFLSGYYLYDFRFTAPSFFNTLASFCEVSANHIDNNLVSFNASLYITGQALTPATFAVEANAIINSFISSMTRSFALNLALSSNMSKSNALMSTHMTNYIFLVQNAYPTYPLTYEGLGYLVPSGDTSVVCYCSFTTQCSYPLSTYTFNGEAYVTVFAIPGLFSGCLLNEGIRSSTLICLFNQTCTDLITYLLNISSINAMDINDLISFNATSTINDIANEVFVDQWTHSISHRSFYEQCLPDTCTYTLVQNNSFWFILTTIFGLIGGLIKILQVITPYLVRGVYALYFRYRYRNRRETLATENGPTFSFRSLINRLRQLNLFSSDNPIAIDEREIKSQITSTRIFLVLLVLSVVVLTIYSSQTQLTKTITISNPSIDQYQSLYNEHSGTLTCPCTNIVISQEIFLTIQPIFHQVCESDFVTLQWLNGLNNITASINSYTRDFRFLGEATFATIRSFCHLSLQVISDGLLDFGMSSFITIDIIPQNQLLKQGQSLIDLFISTNENTFITSLQTIRDTTQTNSLLSGAATSTSVRVSAINETSVQMVTRPKTYNLSNKICSCYEDPTCIEPAGLYIYPGKILYYTIPSFFIGCYMVEATLKSNLAALYNQSWLDAFLETIAFYNFTSGTFNVTALNASLHSQYNTTTPINTFMQNLMIESWNTDVNYSAYYEQCHPNECKYTYIVNHDVIYIVTTIIGLIGGLVTIFQLVIPRAVKLIQQYQFKLCRQTTVQVVHIESVSHNI